MMSPLRTVSSSLSSATSGADLSSKGSIHLPAKATLPAYPRMAHPVGFDVTWAGC